MTVRSFVDRLFGGASLVGLVRGIVGGVFGTVTMTVYRAPLFEGLPPTAEFWARFVGTGDPEDYPLTALVLHVLYGAMAGGVFGAVFGRLWDEDTGARGRLAMTTGVVYSLFLSLFGSRVMLRRLLGIELSGREALIFHVGHVVYGLTLGTWVGTETEDGRSDD